MGIIERKVLKLRLLCASALHSKSYMKIYNKYLQTCGADVSGNIKYIHPSVYVDMGYAPHIHIGKNCVISVNTIILAHDYSVECGMSAIGLGDLHNEKKTIKDVHIEENVFIGAGCTILPGTHIGKNCIIGAGTVCSGDIPDDSVVVGGKWRVIAKTTEWITKQIEKNDGMFG